MRPLEARQSPAVAKLKGQEHEREQDERREAEAREGAGDRMIDQVAISATFNDRQLWTIPAGH